MPKKNLPVRPDRYATQQLLGAAVIYARFSSHKQKELSIDQQVEACRKLAGSYGLTVLREYADKAVSVRSDDRQGFRRMMRDAEDGLFCYVIAWKSNRIGRNMMEALMNETRLNDLGVRVLYVEEDFDDTASGRFAARNMMNINQFYSEAMAEDVIRGMHANARQCISNGPLPYGYRARPKTLEIEIDEPKAAFILEVFRRVAAGEPFMDILRDLNSRGFRTDKGKPWTRSSFNRILKNERYRGIYIYDDVRIEGGIPRIVPDDIFFAVQQLMESRRHATVFVPHPGENRAYYMLTGTLFCAECGGAMVGVSGTGKNGIPHYYYSCNNKRLKNHAARCKAKNVRREDMEDLVVNAVRQYILTDETICWIADQVQAYQMQHADAPELQAAKDRRRELKESISNLLAAVERGLVTRATQERLTELEDELAGVERNIAALAVLTRPIPREDVIAYLYMFKDTDDDSPEFRKKLVQTFVKTVYHSQTNTNEIVFAATGTTPQTVDIQGEIKNTNQGEAPVRILSPLVSQKNEVAKATLTCYGYTFVLHLSA